MSCTKFVWLGKEAYAIVSLFLLLASCQPQQDAANTPAAFREMEDLYLSDLTACIGAVEKLKSSALEEDAPAPALLQEHYRQARMYFKYAEPVLAFVDAENYRFLNQPNILKVEEEDFTDIKIREPSGFQVLEELVFADSPEPAQVARHAALVSNRLQLIRRNSRLHTYQAYHFLWMLRQGIARVALTGLTGFDSPVLENSIEESAFVYGRLKKYLGMFRREFKDVALYQDWNRQLDLCLAALAGDFTSFNRYAFIKDHTHPQLALWVQTQADWGVDFPFSLALRHEATSLFSATTFNLPYFDELQSGNLSPEKVLLGKKLFSDASLSASGAMSCASCHQEALAFTDGLVKSQGQARNSPTLRYAALQQGFFYDKRSGSLEGQIVSVVNSETEFHSNLEAMRTAVQQQPFYRQQFEVLYEEGITEASIRNAIASYIKSLAPFNSRFDRSISGEEQLLSASEIRGFNLFSGKAKCATCHFAPLFNGTVPPEFTETELELLGVPATTDTLHARIDPDEGRYNLFGTEERKYFFKTPTLRNIALTAPYMHNGVYGSLEEVMDFYKRGGGAGLGIELEHQTLPPDKLDLSRHEIQDIIAFMHSLTDEPRDIPMKYATTQQE